MRFGKTLREATYGPWKDKYIDYSKLKSLLREDNRDDDTQWTEEDEIKFSDEIFNVQLEKVCTFQQETVQSFQQRIDEAFDKLKELAPGDDKAKGEVATQPLKDLKAEIDTITNEIEQLKKYSSVNYTGFLKIVKKHDRKRGDRYKVRPLMKLRLSERGLNAEKEYSPLLKKLSTIYYIIDSHLEAGGEQMQPPDLEHQEEVKNGERYTAHKCKWSSRPTYLAPFVIDENHSLGPPGQPARGQDIYPASPPSPSLQRFSRQGVGWERRSLHYVTLPGQLQVRPIYAQG